MGFWAPAAAVWEAQGQGLASGPAGGVRERAAWRGLVEDAGSSGVTLREAWVAGGVWGVPAGGRQNSSTLGEGDLGL